MGPSSVAQRQSEKWPRVYWPAFFQQREEEVGAKADTGMADDPHFIASSDCTLSQGRGDGGEMAVYADIPFMLDQHLQSTRAAVLDAE
jgi:hypothetical protein